jgi:hypothetical protein
MTRPRCVSPVRLAEEGKDRVRQRIACAPERVHLATEIDRHRADRGTGVADGEIAQSLTRWAWRCSSWSTGLRFHDLRDAVTRMWPRPSEPGIP